MAQGSVATVCVAGSMRSTDPAQHGSAKTKPAGCAAEQSSGATATPRSHLNLPLNSGPIRSQAPVATVMRSTRLAWPGTP